MKVIEKWQRIGDTENFSPELNAGLINDKTDLNALNLKTLKRCIESLIEDGYAVCLSQDEFLITTELN